MSQDEVLKTRKQFMAANQIDENKFGIYQFLIIALCMTINMVDGFDITSMAVVATEVGSELQIAEEKLGFVFSSSLAGMMLGAMFLAALSDIFGRRKVILFSLLVVGVSVLMTAYVATLYQMIVLRFVSGLGAGAMLASQATLASEYSPSRYQALAVAVVTAGYPLGAMLTGVVAEIVVPQFGWRSIFIVGGAITLCLWVIALALLPESLQFLCNKAPKDALKKVNRILTRLSLPRLNSMPESSIPNTQSMLKNMTLLLAPQYRLKTITLWISFMLAVFTLYFFLSWLPSVLISEGYDPKFGRQAFTVFNLGGVIGIFLLGVMATRIKLSVVVAIYLFLAASLMVGFGLIDGQPVKILAAITIIGILMQGGFTGLYALSTKLYSSEIRSTGVGWAIGLGRLGAVFGPAVAGYLIADGLSMNENFIVFAIPVLLASVGILTLKIR